MKIKIIVLIVFFHLTPIISCAQGKTENKQQKTWTYTFLKAKQNEKQNFKTFLMKNWFAMDSIAVSRGLFNNYKLIENTSTADSTEWDYIVAVEYFTPGTFSDIAKEWQEIRKNHKTVLVNGKGMKDLGSFVKTEKVIEPDIKNELNCEGNHLKLIEPFIGEWYEYLVTEDDEELYGKLSIKLDSQGCGIRKEFKHLLQPFSYSTLGYFDKPKNKWIETYTFSNGGYSVYEWHQDGTDFILRVTQSAFKQQGLFRNRWKVLNNNLFQIIVEQSIDEGKTWNAISTTNMKRIGY